MRGPPTSILLAIFPFAAVADTEAAEVARPNLPELRSNEPTAASCSEDDATCSDSEPVHNANGDPGNGGAYDGEPPIGISPSSSILDFLDDSLLDEDVLADIRENMLAGKLVIIRDAFKPEFAEWAHFILSHPLLATSRQQYVSTHTVQQYRLEEDFFSNATALKEKIDDINSESEVYEDPGLLFSPNNVGHNSMKMQHHSNGPRSSLLRNVFNNTKSREFMTKISGGRSCEGNQMEFTLNEYRSGDFSSPHSDFRQLRSTNLVWNLSKDWKPEWGGSLYWANVNKPEDGYLYPTFNSVAIFIPSASSTHLVTPVRKDAKGQRLTVTAKFSSVDERPYTIERPIEEWYGTHPNDVMKIPAEEAQWILRHMNPEDVSDLERRQKLKELKDSVSEYLRPFDESVFLIDSVVDGGDSEDEDRETGAENEEYTLELTEDSNVLDLLDPSLLDDDDLLDEIKSALLDGKLVIIRDAFRIEYARHVMNTTIADIEKNQHSWNRGFNRIKPEIPGHYSSRANLERPKYSDEMKLALDPLDHPKSLEFFRTLVGHKVDSLGLLRPSIYEKGDYTNPHSDHSADDLTFLWHLSDEDYFETWYHHASFNTVYMFISRKENIHGVTPVSWWSKGTRLTIGGWYKLGSNDEQPLTDDQVLELAENGDLSELTWAQKRWLARDMSAEAFAAGTSQLASLQRLASNAAKELEHPKGTQSIFVIDSPEEIEDD
ncbi:hypothetical protein THAOC_01215 [Thalassiosira oceanica]|uniref:Prolyl 3,4-dihydroxylase TPA1/OFD1 N-terminal domain-containing protein n=1 Tax=Thalassiosira oceanica TaxID=159749 RepID=K0THN4_THAOC|nr:hypothetical protein THAOC_01215 [Thalassiosira oceanica]|eukprot:EJK76985.1 hypothetical protein THAOC_01215 [Thalassiosira oceanica]